MRRIPTLSIVLALVASAFVVAVPPAASAPDHYVEMSDGVEIAVSMRIPEECTAANPCPAIFEMSGYDGGSAQDGTLAKDFGIPTLQEDSSQLTHTFRDAYAVVHASARGTGCSGGEFDLFSWRIALDGRELIEWIAEQEWSNGDVGLIGHSYGGITGFMVAATQPPSLRAANLSGLIDDLYRGIVYPGGVSNFGFPLIWTAGIRTAYDVGGGLLPGLVRPAPDDPDGIREGCARASSTKSRTVLNDPIVQGIADTDNDWWRARALATYAERINVPIHITGAYQDEQTGPRGPARLWEMIDGVPKRLLLSNGNHGTNGPYRHRVLRERRDWMDHWMGLVDHSGRFGALGDIRTDVSVMLETVGGVENGLKTGTRFPLEDTVWTDYHLRAGGELSPEAPDGGEGSSDYVSGSPRQGWSYQAGHSAGAPFTTAEGPDGLTFRSDPMTGDLVIAGPITANLHVASTAPETELFVEIIDEAPDGTRIYLQRGLLRASHRAITSDLSDCVDPVDNERVACTEDGAFLYRPHRPHTNPTPIQPGEVYEYLVEVFPVGHVFRDGHRIVVKVHTPPAVDSYYVYVPRRPVGVNTVHHDAERPSRVTLPVVPLDFDLGAPRGPCTQEHVRCVR